MTKKGFIISLVSFICLSFNIEAFTQNYSETKTDLIWVEDHSFFYSEHFSDDYYLQNPYLVSYDEVTDSITVNNYLKGYFILDNDLEDDNLIKYNIKDFSDDIVSNSKLIHSFYQIKEKEKRIKLNEVWVYSLAIVTYQEVYLGRFKKFVPEFNSSKDKVLKYIELEIPIYFIKIINIEPYN